MKDAVGLTTQRLTLRRFTHDDLPTIRRLNSDAAVMRYLGGVQPPQKNDEMFNNRILKYYDEHPGLGVWATIERATGECVGFHLLNYILSGGDIQVGYRLFPQHWGKGYATEMSIALLRYGYEQLQLAVITANAHRENRASIHVLEKCGLQRKEDRVIDHPGYANIGAVAWFERPSNEWLREFSA
ncbi:MAG TPA: GNAT family N-acetyltransferase [Nevskiaceae bacterium]|nr:GNAT family N-acetyltransferase [Nevskiaceae bacterium]